MSRRSHSNPYAVAAELAKIHFPALPLTGGLMRWLPFDLVRPIAIIGDFFVILLSGTLAGVAYQWFFLKTLGDVSTYISVGALVAANFCTFSATQQNYLPTNLINFGRQLRYTSLNWLVIFAMLTIVAFTLKVTATFSRGSTLSFFAVGWMSLITFRAFLAESLIRALQRGAFSQQKYVLIAERGQSANATAMQALHRCGYRPASVIELNTSELSLLGGSVARKIQDLVAGMQTDPVNCVFLLLRWTRVRQINKLLHLLRAVPAPVYLLPDEFVGTFLAGRLDSIGPTLAVELQRSPLSKVERAAKRGFDLVAASLILALLSPLMLMTALSIKLDSSGPVLFRQRRNGFHGKTFYIYKFRTMHVLEDGKIVTQAKRNDPRITNIGRWLRRTSIDELPQLFNVLKGQMSIVGPRPHAVAHNDQYQEIVANYAFRHHVKPGITGWAQVNGFRGETSTVDSMAQRIQHDLWYIDHWTPWLDIRILLRTVVCALHQDAAY
jgi:Undecaprenyl-phosphate glucose phosphotransferase